MPPLRPGGVPRRLSPNVVEVVDVENQGVRVKTNRQPRHKRWKMLVTVEEQKRLDEEAAVQEVEQRRLQHEAAFQEFERRLEANSVSCYAMVPTGSSSSSSSSSVNRDGAAAAADAEKALLDCALKTFADVDAAIQAEEEELYERKKKKIRAAREAAERAEHRRLEQQAEADHFFC